MLPLVLSESVNVLRRANPNAPSASRDQLNNPVYGSPQTWAAVYTKIQVRVSLTGKKIKWAATGDLVYPEGILYYSPQYTLQSDDRIVVQSSQQGLPVGVEYIVTSIWPMSLLPSGTPDHWCGELQLPQS
jgi:hypothetical protein